MEENISAPKRSKLSLKTKDSFRKYGIKTYIIEANGKAWNKYQYIERKGNPIAILSSKYQVLPNELVIEKADQIAQKLDARPFTFDDRQWFSKYEAHEHVLASKNLASMSALYVFREDVDITGEGDYVHLGYSVGNAIDGSRAFSVAIFTFRQVCSNFMLHLHSEKMLKVVNGQQITANLRLNQTQTLASVSRKHTKSLSTDTVLPTIKNVIKSADSVIQRYRAMKKAELLEKQAAQIVNYLPKRVYGVLPYIDVNEDNNKVTITQKVSQWQAFNDLTQALSHGKGSFGTTLDQMRRIDAIFA
jgi:AraC-like DNA-binding protein